MSLRILIAHVHPALHCVKCPHPSHNDIHISKPALLHIGIRFTKTSYFIIHPLELLLKQQSNITPNMSPTTISQNLSDQASRNNEPHKPDELQDSDSGLQDQTGEATDSVTITTKTECGTCSTEAFEQRKWRRGYTLFFVLVPVLFTIGSTLTSGSLNLGLNLVILPCLVRAGYWIESGLPDASGCEACNTVQIFEEQAPCFNKIRQFGFPLMVKAVKTLIALALIYFVIELAIAGILVVIDFGQLDTNDLFADLKDVILWTCGRVLNVGQIHGICMLVAYLADTQVNGLFEELKELQRDVDKLLEEMERRSAQG